MVTLTIKIKIMWITRLTKRKRWLKEENHFHFLLDNWIKGHLGIFSRCTFTFHDDFSGQWGGLLGLSLSLSRSLFRLTRRRIWVKEVDQGLSLSTWRSTPAPRPKTGYLSHIICFYKQYSNNVHDNHHHQLRVHPQEGRSSWNCDQEDNLLLLPWSQVLPVIIRYYPYYQVLPVIKILQMAKGTYPGFCLFVL